MKNSKTMMTFYVVNSGADIHGFPQIGRMAASGDDLDQTFE